MLSQWEHLKRAEKHGTRYARPSALDGIPRHLPALLRAEKLLKKARKAKLLPEGPRPKARLQKHALAKKLFALVGCAQRRGWSAEELLREETRRREQTLRQQEARRGEERTD